MDNSFLMSRSYCRGALDGNGKKFFDRERTSEPRQTLAKSFPFNMFHHDKYVVVRFEHVVYSGVSSAI